jgi:hypothetical protein
MSTWTWFSEKEMISNGRVSEVVLKERDVVVCVWGGGFLRDELKV